MPDHDHDEIEITLPPGWDEHDDDEEIYDFTAVDDDEVTEEMVAAELAASQPPPSFKPELDAYSAELYALARRSQAGVIARTDANGDPVTIGTIRFEPNEGTEGTLYLSITEKGFIPGLEADGREYSMAKFDRHALLDLLNAPQGYLAKVLARRHNLPAPKDWNSGHIVEATFLAGGDLTGGLMFGPDVATIRRCCEAPEPDYQVGASDEIARLHELAATYDDGERATKSNVGGAKPKFLSTVTGEDGVAYQAIVKYSTPGTPTFEEDSRQLVLEHACLESLRKQGVRAAPTRLIRDPATGQVFLEVRREDRDTAPNGRMVRKHWLSAGALAAVSEDPDRAPETLVGEQAVAHLKRAEALGASPGERLSLGKDVTRYWSGIAFSHLVGNIDLHHGNVSLVQDGFHRDGSVRYRAAPFYDIEPYAMRGGMQAAPWLGDRTLIKARQSEMPVPIFDRPWAMALDHRQAFFQETAALHKAGWLSQTDMQAVREHFTGGVPDAGPITMPAEAPASTRPAYAIGMA